MWYTIRVTIRVRTEDGVVERGPGAPVGVDSVFTTRARHKRRTVLLVMDGIVAVPEPQRRFEHLHPLHPITPVKLVRAIKGI
eukprot:1294418-Pyramimonas_sp.AAC.1